MSERRVRVETLSQSYDVIIGSGLLADAGRLVSEVCSADRIAVVTDANVAELFGQRLVAQVASKGFELHPLTVAAGEASKSWEVVGQLLEAFASLGISRTDAVMALGGGVVGDLAGFAAAAYLRGVDFIQVPTTLLAQVDSSVGGKTGVDLRAGKNLAGAFKQPLVVLADTDTLLSLPESEWRSGLAEVAKSAVISGEEFLRWLEARTEQLSVRETGVTADTVQRCVEFKSSVVSTDEREEGVRECLNYGHTLAHAIEKVAGYGVVSHGAAVAEGIRFASRLAVEVLGAPREFVARQDALLDRLGLNGLESVWSVDELLSAMHSDKKAREGRIRFVLADAAGSWRCEAVDDVKVREHLTAWAASKGGN